MSDETPDLNLRPNGPLYKYLPLGHGDDDHRQRMAWLTDLVTHGKVWLSSPLDFNDPFDSYPSPEEPQSRLKWEFETKKMLRRLASLLPPEMAREAALNFPRYTRAQLSALLKQAARATTAELGVYCLTESPDSPTMWAHYADNGRGVCVRFRLEQEPISHLHAVVKVHYTDERPRIPLMSAGENGDEVYTALRPKATHWRYEQEWRCIMAAGAHKTMLVHPVVIDSIIFGFNCPADHREEIKQMVRATGRAFSFFSIRPCDQTFSLILNPEP